MDSIDFNILGLLLTLETFICLHTVQKIQGPGKASGFGFFFFFLDTLSGYPTTLYFHLRKPLEPGRCELTTVATLAVPRRCINLSLNYYV